jgi:hypothetical protein
MNPSQPSRFNLSGAAIGVGVGTALCASSGPAVGIPLGLGLAVVFGLTRKRKC